MNADFIKYLESIGLVGPLIDRVSFIMDICQHMCPDTFTDIFVSEYLKEDGMREFESLWLFSEKYCMEAKAFIVNNKFDLAPFKKRVFRFEAESKDYDFKKATEKSRLTVNFFISEPSILVGILKASKENCDYLRAVLHKHIISNMLE